jgi:hypothetical protein
METAFNFEQGFALLNFSLGESLACIVDAPCCMLRRERFFFWREKIPSDIGR